jgi:hypothetical protein
MKMRRIAYGKSKGILEVVDSHKNKRFGSSSLLSYFEDTIVHFVVHNDTRKIIMIDS